MYVLKSEIPEYCLRCTNKITDANGPNHCRGCGQLFCDDCCIACQLCYDVFCSEHEYRLTGECKSCGMSICNNCVEVGATLCASCIPAKSEGER